MNERLDRGFVEVSDIRRGLARLLAQHHGRWVDETECVNNDLAFDRLDRVNDNSHSSWIQLFKRLLRVDIDAGQPAAETGMRMVPTHHDF